MVVWIKIMKGPEGHAKDFGFYPEANESYWKVFK